MREVARCCCCVWAMNTPLNSVVAYFEGCQGPVQLQGGATTTGVGLQAGSCGHCFRCWWLRHGSGCSGVVGTSGVVRSSIACHGVGAKDRGTKAVGGGGGGGGALTLSLLWCGRKLVVAHGGARIG